MVRRGDLENALGYFCENARRSGTPLPKYAHYETAIECINSLLEIYDLYLYGRVNPLNNSDVLEEIKSVITSLTSVQEPQESLEGATDDMIIDLDQTNAQGEPIINLENFIIATESNKQPVNLAEAQVYDGMEDYTKEDLGDFKWEMCTWDKCNICMNEGACEDDEVVNCETFKAWIHERNSHMIIQTRGEVPMREIDLQNAKCDMTNIHLLDMARCPCNKVDEKGRICMPEMCIHHYEDKDGY